ncbi:hypothetical protein [Paenibacillus xylanilyticus]|uniref:HTH LytTR-type domain-containing protein n=1 Tax=Paenibacillus xylanilyticus TaxID=248903 RepID=A0A7Y6BTG4_9BACL|nr:hypothetical protein [Paenibacillus xylanilyticus]NUU74642.1 hypothetical protein [Paenibacillus xylanilyticus]
MSLLALVYDPDQNGQLTNIRMDDTLYIESVNRTITFHHINGKAYKSPQRLEDFDKSTFLKYMKLIRLDHRNFIKVSAIRHFVKETGTVYFDDDPNDSSLIGHVAERNREFLDLTLQTKDEPLELYALVIDEIQNELININIDDCLLIETVNRIITFHHKNGTTYQAPQKMKDFSNSRFLKKNRMLRLDHRNYIQLTYIRVFDIKNGLVYFEEKPKPWSKKAHVAGKNRAFLEMQLQMSDEDLLIVNR